MTSIIPRQHDEKGTGTISYTGHQMDVLRNEIAPNCTENQFALFLEVVRQTGLNPFDRQIYAVVRGKGSDAKMTIQTGIDGYRLQAQRTGEYGGSVVEWCGPEGEWRDVWLDDKTSPFAAKATVYRNGEKYIHIAKWSEYSQTDAGGGMWKKMPSNQLGKCAEAGALRKGFPAELSGFFVDAEDAAIDLVDKTNRQREQRSTPVQQPQRKSATKAPPVNQETGEIPEDVVDSEATELPADTWEGFWNILSAKIKTLKKEGANPNVSAICKALSLEGAGLPTLKTWYTENGASAAEAAEYVADCLSAEGYESS